MKTKTCPRCKQTKEATSENFYRQSRNKDGLSYACKDCKKKSDREWRDKNQDAIKKYQKTPSFVFSQLKYQAKKRNMPFELTFDYYVVNLVGMPCHYCGEIDTKFWIDRVNNDHNIGYTAQNSVSCCELCNKMKSALEEEVFIEHCKKIAHFNLKKMLNR